MFVRGFTDELVKLATHTGLRGFLESPGGAMFAAHVPFGGALLGAGRGSKGGRLKGALKGTAAEAGGNVIGALTGLALAKGLEHTLLRGAALPSWFEPAFIAGGGIAAGPLAMHALTKHAVLEIPALGLGAALAGLKAYTGLSNLAADYLHARALAGRLARGGAGLTSYDIGRIADVLNTSPARAKRIVTSMGSKSAPSHPIARAMTSSLNPLVAPLRVQKMHALAQHGLTGAAVGKEREVIQALRRARRKDTFVHRVLPGAAAAGIGLEAVRER